ncbi:MAG: hypothetical protein DME25_12075, partial [Verrucomicrobia bacterium]
MKTGELPQGAVVLAMLLGGLFDAQPTFAATCPRPNFVAAGMFAAGNQPVAVAVGDFNGDGKTDVVVANQFSANVSVLLGQGNGSFQPAVNYAAGAGPSAVAVGDFNGDGKVDLVVTDLGSTVVWVLLGNGNGTFQAPVSFDAADTAQSVTVGDFDRNGKLDLAVANRGLGAVSVLAGNGDGSFAAPTTYLTGTDPLFVGLGDFDRNGPPDLAVADAALFDDVASDVAILLSRGNGTFRAAVNYSAGTSPRAVGVGDFNGDGNPDLAVADYGALDVNSQFTNSSVSVLLGNGDGTFQAPISYAAGEGPLSLVVTDFNSDGRPDLAVANYRSRSVSVLFGKGDGTFEPPANYSAGFNPHGVAVGDFNGDGLIDITVVNDNGVLILLSTCVIAADLSITQTDTPDPVATGSNLVYTLTVANGGPNSVPDAIVTDQLPAGVSFVTVTTSQGSCTNSDSGAMNCALGNLASAAGATVTITVTTGAAGSLTNTAIVSSATTTDANTANNSATVVTTVLPLVSIAATDSSASETGPDPGLFTVSRAGGTTGALTVNYNLGGTASNGVDYVALAGSVTIPDGSVSATITVTPVDDSVVEPTETIIATLAPNSAYAIDSSANSATVSLLDNDLPSLSISNATVTEGNTSTANAVFRVSLSSPSPQTVTVDFATADGTAIAGSDYIATNGLLSFAPGTTNQNVLVPVQGDLLNEANETFFVNLSNPTNAVISGGQAMVTINNDDPLPSLSINDVTVTEGDSGSTNAVFTVSLSAASGQTVTVSYATTDGTATAGNDYIGANGTLTFLPGIMTQPITVEVIGD